jgi:hypothetical protein
MMKERVKKFLGFSRYPSDNLAHLIYWMIDDERRHEKIGNRSTHIRRSMNEIALESSASGSHHHPHHHHQTIPSKSAVQPQNTSGRSREHRVNPQD